MPVFDQKVSLACASRNCYGSGMFLACQYSFSNH